MILTPDGRMSRYLYGIEYDPQTIKLSLVEAGEGKIGSAMDQIILFCFHYDETKGRYGPAAMAVMRVAGVLCVIGLAGMVYFFARGASRQADTPAETPQRNRIVGMMHMLFSRLGLDLLQDLGVLGQTGGSFWLPPPEATSAYVVDAVFKLILAVSAFFFAVIVILMILFVIIFRRREGVEPGATASYNTRWKSSGQ